jgi:azurin
MKKLILVFGAAALLASCGNNSESTEEESNETVTEETTDEDEVIEEETSSADVQLTLSSNDQMQFDKTELKVKAGQVVELKLEHTGKMPKEAMGHNFVLLQAGTDLAAFAAEAMGAKETDYIPEDNSAIIAHTGLIGGGESTSVVFDAPEVGTYDYICSFPGHYGVMQGKFIVE